MERHARTDVLPSRCDALGRIEHHAAICAPPFLGRPGRISLAANFGNRRTRRGHGISDGDLLPLAAETRRSILGSDARSWPPMVPDAGRLGRAALPVDG